MFALADQDGKAGVEHVLVQAPEVVFLMQGANDISALGAPGMQQALTGVEPASTLIELTVEGVTAVARTCAFGARRKALLARENA